MPSFKTVRFGNLDYRDDDVITLPGGLMGMPTLQRWLILEMGDDAAMRWLQSLDRADFGFPVCQPELYLDDYGVSVPASLKERMGNRESEDLTTLIITTVHPGGERVTGNMLAPLVIDTATRRGAQLVLDGDTYSLRQEIDYLKFGLAVGNDSADNTAEADGTADQGSPVAETSEAPEAVGV